MPELEERADELIDHLRRVIKWICRTYRSGGGGGVVVELLLLLVVVAQAGAAPGGGGQDDGRRVHRMQALILHPIYYLDYDGRPKLLPTWIEFHGWTGRWWKNTKEIWRRTA